MSKRIKGITIELDGETTGLDKALKDVNKRSSEVNNELRDIERLLKFDPSNAEALAQKQKLLADQVENSTQKLKQLQAAEKEVEQQFNSGKIGEEQFRSFKREVQFAEKEVINFKAKLATVDGGSLSKAEKGLKGIKDAAEKAESSLESLESSFKSVGKGAVALGAAGSAAIGGLVTGMEDYNRTMARLNANSMNGGFNPQVMEEATQKVAALTGEMDSAVETVSNLMQTDLTEQQISTVLDEINGAAIRFSDTLKTEGIADGLQETLATGQAIGPFAELLERSGVELEKFDAGLAKAQKSGDATNYVLQQLSELGLASTYEEYKKLNPELFAQQEAQQQLTAALGELSIALTPLVTTVSEFLTDIVEWANKNIELVKSFDSISEGLTALMPQLLEQGINIIKNIIQGISNAVPLYISAVQQLIPLQIENMQKFLPDILQMGGQLLTTLLNGIVELIPLLIAQSVELTRIFINTISGHLPAIIRTGVDILLKLIDGIYKTIPQLVSMVATLIVKMISEFVRNLPQIIQMGGELILALIDGLVALIPKLLGIVWDIGSSIVDELSDVDWIGVGKNIIDGMVKGVKSVAGGLIESVTGVVDSAISGAKKLLGIASPSKVFKKFGVFTGEGYEIGMISQLDAISKASKKMVDASLPDIPNIRVPNVVDKQATTTQIKEGNTYNFYPQKAIFDERDVTREINRAVMLYG
ncbi:phage tail protein [Bacillus weihaiensis]|uniref:Phage tail protein n=1 Tax=Bacillus weihaiensis TaxID=1547283 RepID=A0A1L3MY37_9BACI|nr:hypothetical protein [Bacillus weihaiensis]APH07210.1 hypothetical protein A9C19_20715 [Bacillus weihaiensis]